MSADSVDPRVDSGEPCGSGGLVMAIVKIDDSELKEDIVEEIAAVLKVDLDEKSRRAALNLIDGLLGAAVMLAKGK